jgi:hypothetical protein
MAPFAGQALLLIIVSGCALVFVSDVPCVVAVTAPDTCRSQLIDDAGGMQNALDWPHHASAVWVRHSSGIWHSLQNQPSLRATCIHIDPRHVLLVFLITEFLLLLAVCAVAALMMHVC